MCPNPEAANSPTGMGPEKPVDIILFCAKSSHVPENGFIVGKGKVPCPSLRCELGAGAVLAGLRRNGLQSQGHCQCPGSHLCLQCHRPHSERREREGCVSSPQHQGRVPGRSTALTWLMLLLGCWILPRFQAGCAVCHQHGDKATQRLGWVWLNLVTVPGRTAHAALSAPGAWGWIPVPSTSGDCNATRLFLCW